MNETQSYEKIVKPKCQGKLLTARIGLIIAYLLFAVVGVILAILLGKGHPALFVLVALLDFCLWLLTHRLVEIEYEYAFFSGVFQLSKIMGKASRRELFEEEISKAIMIAPYNDAHRQELERHEIQKTYFAASSKSAQDIWFMLFEKESGAKALVIFDADDRALKLLRKSAPRAVSREKLTGDKYTTEDTNNA